jgi:UDP-glucose 4-epimerase
MSFLKKSNISADWKDKEVLITGGAGFIGSCLTETLVGLGSKVKVIDNLSEGKLENIKHLLKYVNFIEGDIRDLETVKKVIRGQECIFHLAANASVPNSIENLDYDLETNFKGTYNFLKAIHQNKKGSKLIYASSAAVYGEPKFFPVTESHPLSPISPYGASKLSGEAYCLVFNRVYNLKTVALRLFNVYGPKQPRYVIFDLLSKNETSFMFQMQ